MAYYPYQSAPYQGQIAAPAAQAQAPDKKKMLFSQLVRLGSMAAPMLINMAISKGALSGKGGSE